LGVTFDSIGRRTAGLAGIFLLASGVYAGGDSIMEALRSGQFAAALEQASKELKTAPANPRLWFFRGMAEQNLGQAKEALASYRRAVKLDPRMLAALEAEAQLEYGARDQAAAETLARIVRLRPDSAPAHGMLGALAYERKDCAAATSEFEKAGEALNSNPLALWQAGNCLFQLRRADEAAAKFQRSLELGAGDASDAVQFNLGLALLDAKRPKEAVAALLPLVAPDRPQSGALSLLAAAYEGDKQTPEALRTLRRAADLYPREERHYIDFASICMEHSSLDIGIEVLEVGIRIVPQSARLHATLGALEVRAGQMERAEAMFTRAQELAPEAAYGEVGMSLALLQSDQIDESIRRLRQQWERNPRNPMVSFMLAQALLRQETEPGKPAYEEAQRLLRRTLELDPSHARAHGLLGKNYALEGATAKAIRELEEALRLAPDDRTSAYQLALLYVKTGQKELSAKWQKRVRESIEAARVAETESEYRVLRAVPERAQEAH
jgi:tetratricopeptide (TPR) repeat protein